MLRLGFYFFLFLTGNLFAQFRAFPGTPLDARRDFLGHVVGLCTFDINGDGFLDLVGGSSYYWDTNKWVTTSPGVWHGRANFGFQHHSKEYHQRSFDQWIEQFHPFGSTSISPSFPRWDINGDGHGDYFNFAIRYPPSGPQDKSFAYIFSSAQPKRLVLRKNILQCPYALRDTMLQADFNGDGHQDIYVLRLNLVTSNYQPFLGLWQKPGKFVDSSQAAFPLNLPYTRVGFFQASIDLEGDGDVDLLFFPVEQPDSTPVVLENDGKGRFHIVKKKFPPFTAKTPGTWGGTAADLDGDGDQDLAICTYLPRRNWNTKIPPPSAIWWNDGKGNFPTQTLFRVPSPWGRTRPPFIFDYDLDGDLDLVYPQWWGVNKRILTVPIENKGKRNFVEHWNGLQPLSMQDPVDWGIVLDLDHDGDLDLFFKVRANAGNRYFFNTHHQLSVPQDPVIGKVFRMDYFVKSGVRFLLAFTGFRLLKKGLDLPKYGSWWLDPGSMLLLTRNYCLGREEHKVEFSIPNDTRLVGLKVYSQGLVLDILSQAFWATTFFENTIRAK
jgi:hypothetical protein